MTDFTSSSRDFAADVRRLSDPHADHAHKIPIATALRDAVDSYTTSDINAFMSILLQPLIQLVKLGQPVFVKDSPEQQLRHMYLEILLRMPGTHEQVRTSAAELMSTAIQIIRVDNEENAVLAIKICVDVFRIHKAELQAHGQTFIDTILEIYKNMDGLVSETFGGGPSGSTASPVASASSPPKSSDGSGSSLLPPAMHSFRVMAECPIATIIFGQINFQLIDPILHFLQVEAEPQKRAREEASSRGEPLLGVSPTIKNKAGYTAFVTAQVKSMSLLAYIIRAPSPGGPPDNIKQNQELLPQLSIRLLQDIPMEAPGVRKEMGVAVRHIVATDFRDKFFPYLDQLLDDRLLVGVGITGREQLRPFAYTALADLVHFRRTDLTPAQLLRVIHVFSCHLHDSTLSPGLQNMSTKVLAALQDQVPHKLSAPENGRVLMSMLESYISKLHATHAMFMDFMSMVRARLKEKEKEKEKDKDKDKEKEKDKDKEKEKDKTKEEESTKEDESEHHAYTVPEIGEMEKLKPVKRLSYVVESSEDIMKDCRLLFRTLLQAIRQLVVLLRGVEGPVPDSELFGQFFEGAFKCLSLWPNSMGDDPREKEVLELFAGVFHELQPHVFQEVWTLRMDFFVNICLEHPVALQVAQSLMANAELSRQLTSIMLKHLVDRLDLLGDQEARSANITLRLFKMVFMSVNLLPEANETVLAPHLTRLIMDSFPLASKAREPMSYYLLIRALFRSISGGKFDRVYNEILPLLQELLENLNRLIAHAEGNIRDLLVELCLTVPVRLTHLLPFLQHLMRPLVLALKGSPEMAAQGLRTLELCIDNLTQDFLEPCFAPVRRDLMGALYDLLRPLPANHLLSHACIRILGKLGGRNRRLQYNHPVLDYHPAAEEAAILLSFDSRAEHINLAPMTTLAAKSIRNSNPTYRKAAFDVLKHATSVFLQDGAQGRERESVFTTAIDGLFNAIHIADLKEQSIQYIRDLSKHIFMAELLNREPGPASSRRYPMSPLATTFVEWLPKSLAWIDKDELKTAEGVVRSLIEDLAAIGKEDVPMDGGSTPREPSGILHNLASAFVGMCHNESWRKKMAGCKGITIMVSTDSLPPKMTLEREFDFVRALISMLKDMPVDPPRDVDEVTDALMDVIKKSDTAPAGEDGVPLHRARMPFLTGILHMELASANAIVRSATQQCITLLSELSGKSPTELLTTHRDRLLLPIYTKPLRALSFATQIGHIDAVTYCLSLNPPLPEPNDELLRLLSEALALADAEDQNLLGRPVHRQNSLALNKLRVACIKLLTASMRATDFFAKQPTVRQKAIQVYFKSLYSQSLDVKNAAHDGLRIVLQHQTRLPKELLQAGLRPILMNLADPKRISVSGLDGLARLLELLTHYFKVEIGVKLLEHYNSIAEPSMLHEAAFSPISTNEEIAKLVKLINIFHLLPAAANMYLENLSNLVVETESHLHAAAPTPFTEVYGQYVDRYADEAVKYFIAKLDSPRHVQTMRNVLIAGIAPNFRDELMVTIPQLLKSQAPDISVPLLLICRDLVNSVPSWLERYPDVLQVLLDAWRNALQGSTEDNGQSIDVMDSKVPSIILSIFTTYLRHSMKVDLLFEVVAVYTVRIPIDLSTFTHFLYQNVIAVESVALKHEVLASFLEQFGSSDVSWAHKTQLLVMVINPMLQAALARKEFNVGLLDGEVVAKIHSQIWHPMAGGGGNPQPGDIFPDADDWLKIQLLQMSSAVIQFAPQLVVDFKKDLIKCGWNFISTDDMFVRQAAYVTTARFFEAFESPVKFVLRLWQSLLRPLKETERNVEDRHLTRVALNILTPVLNKRVPSDMWIRQTRVVLHEEGHTLSALLHIYQVVVGHPDVFYDCRNFLVPHMTTSLPKIGLKEAPLNNTDSRALSLDVVDLILAWERRQQAEAEAMDTSEDDSKSGSWSTPLSLRENIVSYILRFITSIPLDQSGTKGALATRALGILDYLLGPQGWPEVTVKITFFVKVFQQLEFGENATALALNNAKALVIVLKDKDDVYFAANASTIQTLLEKPMMGNDSSLHETLQPVLNRLLAALPPLDEGTQDQATKTLYTWVENTVNEGLKAHTNLSGTLAILHSLVLVQPKRLEGFSVALMKTLTRLTREYTQGPPAGLDLYIPPIKACLEICRANVGYLGDQRGALLKDIVQLVEKSPSTSLCKYLMEVVREWIIERREAMYPNLKEKASLIQRMTSFMRDDGLLNDLLGMVFDIYNEPTLRRSELTIRLEPIYLLGCRAKDPVLRTKFVDMFDESLPKSLSSRLQFVLGSSSWEHLGDQYWIPQALDLLLSSADGHLPLLPDFKQQHQPSTGFSQTVAKSKIEDLLRPVRTLLQLNSQCTHQLWISVFKSIWATLSRKEQLDVTRSMIALLSKDYHFRQVDTKVNVIQSFLAGIHACSPPMSLPPYLVKYLGKTYNAWHVALEILQASLESYREEETSRDGTYDALAEIYSELSEDDMFYGLWRRRSLFNDTNVALSFEQAGMFSVAQAQYEVAQIKSRNGHIPFNEAEYCVWEDHWVLTAQKLQQWDILFDLARAEENPDLLLESAWRHLDWNTDKETIERALNAVADVATPRRRVFEAYTALVRSHGAGNGDRTEFIRLCDEAMQLSLRKWAALPAIVSMSHIPLLQHFQQFVELHEASAIFTALQSTTGATLERKSAELKGVLQAWRERLPNLWDDITIWSDLVSWRQHVFNAINNTYLPLIPQVPQPNPNVPVNTTFGFRGHHETAWIINRFAHVARKHQLPDVCHTSLARIYTLPNIEISEAFLKLREQARCHYQNAAELHAGLEVINNTNLMYFSNAQKAEFYTLKGMFIAKLGHNEEANTAFGQAVQTELNLPKAWAEWGRYNDRLFKETPADMSLAANAVSCYLQAAGLYKSAKTRPLIIRVLWLLSNDDQQATVARAFDNYKGDLALWYWITVIPQLLVALTYKETPHARNMLINLAKTYPQALFFHLRTLREDMIPLRRKHMAAMAAQADSSKAGESSGANGQQTSPTQATSEGNGGRPGVPNQPGRGPRYAWESVDEIVAILKTAFPLLALTMETMVDQFAQRFKATQEEELVRYFNALLMEALQCHSLSVTNQGVEEPPLPMQCLDNVTRFADSALNPETRALFKADVIDPKPNLREYIRKLQVWRDKYEKVLEARPRLQPLDVLSHWLVEFQHSKFDEVEVPGQYLEHKDTNSHFVKIARFASQYELCLGMGFSYRRITILGHDGTKHSFIVQLPTSRTSRREEKLHQLFRIFNSVLVRRKETRKRVLSFYLPAAIPLNPQLRLLENDSSVVGLQDIYDQHLRELGLNKEDPVILHAEKFRAILDLQHKGNPNKQEYMNLRMELFDVVSAKMVPNNILSTYMSRSMADANNLWLLRKQFTTQMAAVTFQSYIMCCVTRTPSRYHISRSTGQIYMSDFTPGYRPNVAPLALGTNEAVPFRFTPNFQAFVGPIGVEGIMTSGIMAIGRTLSEPEYDLEHQLGLFIRDDLIAWHALNNKQINGEPALKPMVAGIVDQICKKAELLSCRVEREGAASAPTNQAYSTTSVQSVVSLISTATNPQLLSRMAEQWLPWL